MSATTTRLSIPYPGTADPAAFNTDMQNIAATIDTKMAVYSQATTPPTPVTSGGHFWWCTDNTSANYGLNYHDGTAWRTAGVYVAVSGSAPASPIKNMLWIQPDTGVFEYYTGSAWVAIFPASGAANTLLTANGSGGSAWSALVAATMTPSATPGDTFRTVGAASAWSTVGSFPTVYNTNSVVLSTSYQAIASSTQTVTGYKAYEISVWVAQGAGTTPNNVTTLYSHVTAVSGGTTDSGDIVLGPIGNSAGSAIFSNFGYAYRFEGMDPAKTYTITVYFKTQTSLTTYPTLAWPKYSVKGLV